MTFIPEDATLPAPDAAPWVRPQPPYVETNDGTRLLNETLMLAQWLAMAAALRRITEVLSTADDPLDVIIYDLAQAALDGLEQA